MEVNSWLGRQRAIILTTVCTIVITSTETHLLLHKGIMKSIKGMRLLATDSYFSFGKFPELFLNIQNGREILKPSPEGEVQKIYFCSALLKTLEILL